MKLEACDKHNPFFIRVCTIVDIEYRKIKIHFDGWKEEYDFWVDVDSEDIHPIFWCEKTDHPLQQPCFFVKPEPSNENEITCPTENCSGIGHVKGSNFLTHRSESGCPYALKNINKDLLPNRLTSVPNSNFIEPLKKYKKEIFKSREVIPNNPKEIEIFDNNKKDAYVFETNNINEHDLNSRIDANDSNRKAKNISIKRGRPKKSILGMQAENNFKLMKKKKLNKEHSDLVKMQVDENKSRNFQFFTVAKKSDLTPKLRRFVLNNR